MYISNKVTKEQLHKKLQKKLFQHCEIKVQLNPYTSVKRRRKKPKKTLHFQENYFEINKKLDNLQID
jgi:hypothetical protein